MVGDPCQIYTSLSDQVPKVPGIVILLILYFLQSYDFFFQTI